jgi:colanic acid biosynthesis glycosyl transferase WcaI
VIDLCIATPKIISANPLVIDEMKILIVGLNYAPEITSTGKYTGEMAEWLSRKGHDVRVVTTPPYYPQWKVQAPYKAFRYKKEVLNNVVVYRCPLYVPAQVKTITRIIHLLSFAISSVPILLRMIFWKPDVVINPVPSLFSSPMVALVAKLSGGKSILHVQDYEVEAMLGLGMANEGVVGKLARAFEAWVLNSFDKVSTISNSMIRKAVEKGVARDNIIFFPNWSDTSHFQDVKGVSGMRAELRVSDDQKLVLYSGNIGDKQGLEQVIAAAERVQDKNCVFVIVGDGAGKQKLIDLVEAKKLQNVRFSPLQPFEFLPKLLAAADCHLVVQRRGVADAVLPSKLTNILAVGGNAVITAEADTELGILCEQHPGVAILVEPELVESLVKGILLAIETVKPNTVAMNYAKEHIEKDKVLYYFERAIFELSKQIS